jgi:molybdopterin synthase catalytic subunit
MRINVLLFARPREIAGSGHLELELPPGATAAEAFSALAAAHPGLAPLRDRLRCAVDEEYQDWSTPLHDGAELALIPPTAGG